MKSPVIAALALVCGGIAQAANDPLDTAKIEQLTGARGKLDAKENVFKVSVPRTDLNVTVAGVKMNPPMGLTSWAAFTKAHAGTMVMGDMVVTEDQVNPVMSAALDNGLEVTALHNHFFWQTQPVMFMHIGGMGDTDKLATAVGKVFATIKDTAGKSSRPNLAIDASQSKIETKAIDAILGTPGEVNDSVYKVTIGRTTKDHSVEVGKQMGVNTWAAFAGTDAKAVVDGDFAMTETELQPVLKTLRANGINIVAIHNHMTGEQPRIVFLHYWGVGAATDLAKGVKAAFDMTNHGTHATR